MATKKQTRSKIVSFRVTPDIYRLVEKAAKRDGLSVSAWAAALLARKANAVRKAG
jgi:uncharacterized protein (DUF1778 family)